mgnify:CR=1 FL=1
MFTSYEYLAGLFHLLLSLFGAGAIIIFFLSKLFVNYAKPLFNLLSQLPGLESIFEFGVKIVRSIALRKVFDSILGWLDAYRYGRKSSLTYGQGTTILFSILVILFYPNDLLVDESIMIALFLLILAEKLYIVFKIKLSIRDAQYFEQSALKYAVQGKFEKAVLRYSKALSLYQKPLLVQNRVLDINRAELLEEMAKLLHKHGSLKRAFLRYQQALKIYQKPHLLKVSVFDENRRKLREQAKIIKIQQKTRRIRLGCAV